MSEKKVVVSEKGGVLTKKLVLPTKNGLKMGSID